MCTIYTGIGCDNFLICDQCIDHIKHTEDAKSIHRFTYPRWDDQVYCSSFGFTFKGMEHVPNIFMSFDKYLFLEVINILI